MQPVHARQARPLLTVALVLMLVGCAGGTQGTQNPETTPVETSNPSGALQSAETTPPPAVRAPSAAETGPQCAAYADFKRFHSIEMQGFVDPEIVDAISAVPGGGVPICAFAGANQYEYGGKQHHVIAFWLPGGFRSDSGSAWIESVMTGAGYQAHHSGEGDYWMKAGSDGTILFGVDHWKTGMDDEPTWWALNTWVFNVIAGDIRK